jgi:hypothetical protein
MLLKVLHKPLRPIRVYMPKLGGIIKGGEIKVRGILKGPIPYGITWRLMLLKVLHKPPRSIRVYMPKLRGIIKEGRIMKLKQGDSQWSNILWDYMEVNAIKSLT